MMDVKRMTLTAILALLIATACGYNVDQDFPRSYSNTDHFTGYLGYTVHLYHEPIKNVSWIIVGDPKGSYEGKTEFGKVYRCTLGVKGECETIVPNNLKNEKSHIMTLKVDARINKEGGWFGSAIAIDELNGMLTVCAPRTIVSILYTHIDIQLDTMHGMCYSGPISSNSLHTEDEDLTFYNFRKDYWYNPIHGFSVRYARKKKNGSKEQEGVKRIIGEPQRETHGLVNIRDSFFKKISVELPLSDDLSHFGYSVETGYFFDGNQLLYVSGAPGWQYVGQVAIINSINSSIVEKLYGTEIGEYFGASLAVGDLNNDGLDDLLVGAPHWGEDNGKVYIYLGAENGQFEPVAPLQGIAEGGHFGYAIASGDLDADGFDDIIVGAPWEGSGVIYIYNGDLDLKYKTLQASERMVHRDAKTFGFSISKPVDVDGNGYPDIAVGAYKSNEAMVLYSKPVINTELIIRTVPEILERDAEQISIKICPQFDGYILQKIQAADYKITVTIDEQYQRTKETVLELKSSNLRPSTCLETQVNVTENIRDFIEPISIIAKHEFVTIKRNAFCNLCPIEKKYNKLNVAEVFLPFNIGCGADRICNSNITVTAKFHGVRDNNTWVMGSNDITLEVSLKNHGEPSYLTTVEFTLPESVLLRSILPSCREVLFENNLIVICDAGNPLREGDEKHVKLDLDMKHLTRSSLYDNKLNFHMKVNSRSTNQGATNATKTLVLLNEVSLSLNGKASEGVYYLSTMNDNTSTITFEHTYQVYKLGATPIEDAKLTIKVPTAIRDSESLVRLYRPQLHVTGEVIECSSDVFLDSELIEVGELPTNTGYNGSSVMQKRSTIESNMEFYDEENVTTLQSINYSLMNNVVYMNCSTVGANCTIVTCDLTALKTLQDIGKVVIKMLLYVDKLKDIFANNTTALIFGTKANVEIVKPAVRLSINGTRSTMEIVTIHYNTPKTEKIQLWIIIVSVSIGLLLLLVIITILNKLGFFKRRIRQIEENTS